MAHAASAGNHDIGLKRVRRQAEPTFKTCSDDALAAPWSELNVTAEVKYAMANVCHFSHATYVQREVVPHFSEHGSSVVVEAATGSGKTLAFLLPAIERLVRLASSHYREHRAPLRSRRVVGVVLAPSRVLAQQTFIVARTISCRTTQYIRFVLCDLALHRMDNIIDHLKRASKITGTVLVGTPSDVERVCCALRGQPYEPVATGTSSAASAAGGSDDEAEDDVDGAAAAAGPMVGITREDLVALDDDGADAIASRAAAGAAGGAGGARAERSDGDSDGLDEEELEMLRIARAKRAQRRAARGEVAAVGASSSSSGASAPLASAEDVAAVAPNPGAPFLLVVDEADVVMKSTSMRLTVARMLATLKAEFPAATVDIGLFGATVSSAPQVNDFVAAAALPKPPMSITLGSNEQFVSKLSNRFVYVAASDMLQALVHMINSHPTKKHFVFFNSAVVLLHVRSVLTQLLDGRRPLLRTGKIFALHEGMKDVSKFNEFGRFLRFNAADAAAENAPKARNVKEARRFAAAAAAREQSLHMDNLEGFANGTKRTGSVLGHATGCVLLCTDVAAFGLDVRDVEYVVHFEAPTTVRSYIHRIGRVARMGMRGLSVMLLPISEHSRTAAPAATAEAEAAAEADAQQAINARMREYVDKLVSAHAVEEANLAASAAPITSNIRAIVERSPELVETAKTAAMAMSRAEHSWYDPLTAIDALTAGAGK